MQPDHPNRRRAVATALGMLICMAGCHGPQTAMTNPFMSPGLVPPPATRAIAPGTAQPYYQGDPLPSAQAAAPSAAPTSEIAARDNQAAATISGREPAPTIPRDNDQLRFALPSPTTTQQPQVAASVTDPAVTPASYVANVPNQTQAASRQDSANQGPWRAPQIPGTATAQQPLPTAPPVVAQVIPATQQLAQAPAVVPQPIAAATPNYVSTMPVTLRAVPPPRIRFSDPTTPIAQATAARSGPVAPAAYVATAPSGFAPVVPTAATPAVSYAPRPTAGPSAPPSRPDGFRRRGSRW